MKRSLLLFIFLTCTFFSVRASHIIGGEMYYKYLGKDGSNNRYEVTLKLFRVCETGGQIAPMPTAVYFSIFSKDDNSRVSQTQFGRSGFEVKQLGTVDPCIVNPPRVCFEIGLFVGIVSVPENNLGYTVAFQSCCRDEFMVNIQVILPSNGGTTGTGATYFTELPGRSFSEIGNSSPVFAKDEAVLVCAGKNFSYDFSATDADGDRLEYEFCNAYTGGQTTPGNGVPPPATSPPYQSVDYIRGFTATQPLGPDAKIDPVTGIISGKAPAAGKYVVTVCVKEFRGNKLLGIHRKDFHINITTCTKLVEAAMPDKYADCSGLTVTFINNSTPGKTYDWDFGDGTTLQTTSTNPIPHTYASEGTYFAKLYVDKSSNCGDSALATVYVYPLLSPSFNVTGLCATKPTSFINGSNTSNPRDLIAYYRWDFGDPGTLGDTSNNRNPQYQYPGPGTYTAKLLMRTQLGCERTISSDITIYDKPPLTVTSDTVLCIKNSLQLKAESPINGTYSWTPNYNIVNPLTATPTVSPKLDTEYKVRFVDVSGCDNTASVKIHVRDTVRVFAGSDSTVCTGDQLQLKATADGPYSFTWLDLNNNSAIVGTDPILNITPPAPTRSYAVEVDLGNCSSRDTINLKMVDPPRAYAGRDTSICTGDEITLNASGGSSYVWSPTTGLSTPRQAITRAKPMQATNYIVTVTDVLGCPKAVNDTVLINVIPPVPAFAGNDTILIKDQPFQLHATGGVRYVWTPTDGLNNPNIASPITNINRNFTYRVTVYTTEGCNATDDIFIRFIAGPEIYIPTGFSPNGDGLNDIFRPIPVGIVQTDFFRVFDRWGRLMYSTVEYLKGWDGSVNGKQAEVGTYVWVIQGKDINGNKVLRKGTVTLIR